MNSDSKNMLNSINSLLDRLLRKPSIWAENFVKRGKLIIILRTILLLTPFSLAKTAYNACFGEIQFVIELTPELITLFLVFLGEFYFLIELLPSREEQRILQLVQIFSTFFTFTLFFGVALRATLLYFGIST